MDESPSWVKQLDGRHRQRSQSVQPGSSAYWDARKTQPLKWQAEYNQSSPGHSPTSPPPQMSRSSSSSGSRSSGLSKFGGAVNLGTIPEDNFLDRGTDFRFVGGIRNPAFELEELGVPQRNIHRRSSEGGILDGSYQKQSATVDHLQMRPLGSKQDDVFHSVDRRQTRRKNEKENRGETNSELSVGGKSVQSATSGCNDSEPSLKSSDTKLSSRTRQSECRRSDSGSRTGSKRRSGQGRTDSERSTSVKSKTNNQTAEPTNLTATPIEIPIEFIETPASRMKKLFGPVIMCILVITLAASLAAAIYFATVLKEAQDQTIELLKAQLEMTTSGVNVHALDEHQRQNLTEAYCREMDAFYRQSYIFRKTYKKCEVDSLTNRKIKFTLYFDEEEDISTTSNIVQVLKARATEETNSKQMQINNLKLDIESVKVTLEKVTTDKSQIDNLTPDAPRVGLKTSPPKQQANRPDNRQPVTVPSITTPSTLKFTSVITSKDSLDVPTTTATTGNPCEGRSGDYFPHGRECNLYIQCHDGESITFGCPLGTVFDINRKVCVDRTSDIICPEKDINSGYDWSSRDPWDPCKTRYEEQYFPYPEDCNLYFQCQYNKSIVRLCPKNTIFDTMQQICVPPNLDVICYTISSPSPSSTVATGSSRGQQTTLPPVQYPSRPVYNPTPCQETSASGLYPHPTNCSHYVICEHKKEKLGTCPENLYFDPKINACVRPLNDMLCPDLRPCEGLDRGFFPHPKLCHKFIMCTEGSELVQSCMHENVWNPRTNTCEPRTEFVPCPDPDT